MPQAARSQQETPLVEAETSNLWRKVRDGTAAHDESVEFQRRIALPFACLAFALIALPLGISTTRGSKSMGLVVSLLLMLAYYLVFAFGTKLAGDAAFSPFLGAWFGNIAFAVLGAILLVRANREGENRVFQGLGSVVDWLKAAAASLRDTRTRVSPWAYPLTHHPKFFRLLDVYVLRGFWFFFSLVLAVFVSLFIVITLFALLPDIVKNKVAAYTVITYFAFYLPQILCYVVPLTVLLATLINLGTLTKTNEILAVKAGAISLYRMALPLIVMSFLLSAAVYAVQDFINPYANQQQDYYHNIIKGKAPQTYRDPHKWMAGSHDRIYH